MRYKVQLNDPILLNNVFKIYSIILETVDRYFFRKYASRKMLDITVPVLSLPNVADSTVSDKMK